MRDLPSLRRDVRSLTMVCLIVRLSTRTTSMQAEGIVPSTFLSMFLSTTRLMASGSCDPSSAGLTSSFVAFA